MLTSPGRRTIPAAASNVRHRPSGLRASNLHMASIVTGLIIKLTPHAMHASASARMMATLPMWAPTSDDEHAVSIATARSRPAFVRGQRRTRGHTTSHHATPQCALRPRRPAACLARAACSAEPLYSPLWASKRESKPVAVLLIPHVIETTP